MTPIDETVQQAGIKCISSPDGAIDYQYGIICAVVHEEGQDSLANSHFFSMRWDMSKVASLWFKCCSSIMTPSTA